MTIFKSIRLRAIGIFSSYLVFFVDGFAANWSIEAQLNQSLGYYDNVRMTTQAQGSMQYLITSILNMGYTTEKTSVLASASYGEQRYFNLTKLDNYLQNYTLNSFYLTPRTRWEFSASFNVAPSRNTAFQDSGNYVSNAQKYNLSLSPSISYQMTELDSLVLSFNYTDTSYSTKDLSGNQSQNIQFNWQKKWSERFNQGLTLAYSQVIFEPNANTDSLQQNSQNNSYSMTLSGNYLYTPTIKFNMNIGGRFTETQTPTIAGMNSNFSSGFLLNTAVHYTTERLTTQLGFSRSLIPSSFGQLQEQTGANFNATYSFSATLSLGLTMTYQLSQSTANNVRNQRDNLMIQPSLNWQLSPEWVISSYYQYTTQNNHNSSTNSNSQTVNANVINLSISYYWQGWKISR